MYLQNGEQAMGNGNGEWGMGAVDGNKNIILVGKLFLLSQNSILFI